MSLYARVWHVFICFAICSCTPPLPSLPLSLLPSLPLSPQIRLITSKGYRAEAHYVTTTDGYILCLHRIPCPQNQPCAFLPWSLANHTKHVQILSLLQQTCPDGVLSFPSPSSLLPSLSPPLPSLLPSPSFLTLPPSLLFPPPSPPFLTPLPSLLPSLPLLLLFSSLPPSLRQRLSSSRLSPARPPLFLHKLAYQSS